MTYDHHQERCYICMTDEGEEAFVDPKPCKCKGSIKIHSSCLEEVKRFSPFCSICKQMYCNPGPDGLITNRKMIRGMIQIWKVDIYGRLQGSLKRYISERLCELDIPSFEISYKDGIPVGEMKYYWIEMDQHEGHWFYIKALKSIDHFVDGVINGDSYLYYRLTPEEIRAKFSEMALQYAEEPKDYILTVEDMQVQKKTTYVNSRKNGLSIKYYGSGSGQQEGQIWKTAEYRGGLKEGTVKTYGLNGKLKNEEHYVNGMKEGDEITYQSDGETVRSKKKFRGNALISIERYDERV